METRECSCRSEFQVAEESDALVRETMDQLRPHFRRQEAYQHAVDYLQGLIAEEKGRGYGFCPVPRPPRVPGSTP